MESLQVTRTSKPRQITPNSELVFGKCMTDHMLLLDWTATEGWIHPRITPYQNLSLDPANSTLQWGLQAFEGMKAFRDKKGTLRLFRPEKNMERMNKSAGRISLPNVDTSLVVDLLKKFVGMEERFVPSERGFCLYIRPNLIASQSTLSIAPVDAALLYVIAFPVGTPPFRAINLETAEHALRASPGGLGAKKHTPNFAPAVAPANGLSQTLWIFPEMDWRMGRKQEYITEAGAMDLFCTMNIFYVIQDTDLNKQLITPPVGSVILEGLMRLCVLELAQERLVPQGWSVSEQDITVSELIHYQSEGLIVEVFGTSTAGVVVPIRSITHNGTRIDCGLEEDQVAGPIAQQMKDWIEEIQYGEIEHPWSVPIEVSDN